jgi:hypothetical protein
MLSSVLPADPAIGCNDAPERGNCTMARFMDVHTHMEGVTPEALMAAHQADLDIEGDEGVHFVQAWGDPKTGHVFCLSEGPDAEAVRKIHDRAGHPADEIHEITITV